MALLFATPLLLGLVLKRALHTETLMAVAKTPVLLATALLMLLAFALRTTGEARLGAVVYGQQASTTLTTGGPFSWTRHPLYWGTGLFAVALGAPYLPWWALVVHMLVTAAVLVSIAAFEEEGLAQTHGAAWQAYAAQVPRFVGVPRPLPAHSPRPTVSMLASGALLNVGMLTFALVRLTAALTSGRAVALAMLINAVGVVVWIVAVLSQRLRGQK